MKLIFDDGTVQECLVTGERQIATGEVLVQPQRAPKDMNIVWIEPATYANLTFVSCSAIEPGHYVMTAQGLKQVAAVER